MRLSEFWRRMHQHLGPAYAESWAQDYHLAALGGRTVAQALQVGVEPQVVWRAVWEALQLPDRER